MSWGFYCCLNCDLRDLGDGPRFWLTALSEAGFAGFLDFGMGGAAVVLGRWSLRATGACCINPGGRAAWTVRNGPVRLHAEIRSRVRERRSVLSCERSALALRSSSLSVRSSCSELLSICSALRSICSELLAICSALRSSSLSMWSRCSELRVISLSVASSAFSSLSMRLSVWICRSANCSKQSLYAVESIFAAVRLSGHGCFSFLPHQYMAEKDFGARIL